MNELNRSEFMQKTGVFISYNYFEIIKIEYQDFINNVNYPMLLKAMNIADTKIPKPTIFTMYWLALNLYREDIQETEEKTFKFCMSDYETFNEEKEADEEYEYTGEFHTMDIIDAISYKSYQWKGIYNKHCDLIHKLLDAGKISKEVADELLSTETEIISDEERYLANKKFNALFDNFDPNKKLNF